MLSVRLCKQLTACEYHTNQVQCYYHCDCMLHIAPVCAEPYYRTVLILQGLCHVTREAMAAYKSMAKRCCMPGTQQCLPSRATTPCKCAQFLQRTCTVVSQACSTAGRGFNMQKATASCHHMFSSRQTQKTLQQPPFKVSYLTPL